MAARGFGGPAVSPVEAFLWLCVGAFAFALLVLIAFVVAFLIYTIRDES